MTPSELKDLKEGKDWNDNLVLQAKSIVVPAHFTFLKRRIYQLRCSSLQAGNHVPLSYLKIIIRYFLGLGFIGYLLFKSKFSKVKIKTPFSIWDSDSAQHVSAEVFNDFLHSNQIVSLNNDFFVFVKSSKSKKPTHFSSALFSQTPIYDAIDFLEISYLDCFLVIVNILKNFPLYLRVSFSCHGTKRLFKDFLIEPLIKLYTKKGLVKFYRTNSDINDQEFWCENIDFNTIWYSINTRAFQFKNSPFAPLPEYSFFYFMYTGTSWTWNQPHAIWLKKFNDHNVNFVGPILFYSFSKKDSPKKIHLSNGPIKILIFDITPFYQSHINAHISQKGFNYYNEKTCLKFISDILEASAENTDWEIFLKPKRKYVEMHSKKYIDFLKHKETTDTRFTIIPTDINLYEEILKSDIVISIPFSSPFDIAKSLKIPALYFDPTGDVDFEGMGYSSDDYAYSISSLKEKISTYTKGV